MDFRTAALAISTLALSTVLATGAWAQTTGGGSNASAAPGATAKPVAPDAIPLGADDMRLWSFGECDRRFPYASSDEHKQCVRVVGSEEARDARAYRVCDVSHERDREEAARCKAAYKANRQKAAQEGYVPAAAAQPAQRPAAPPPDVMRKVRAIAEAAVEQDREATSAEAAAAPAATDPEIAPVPAEAYEFWSPMTLIGTLSLCMLILAVTTTLGRRKLAGLMRGQ